MLLHSFLSLDIFSSVFDTLVWYVCKCRTYVCRGIDIAVSRIVHPSNKTAILAAHLTWEYINPTELQYRIAQNYCKTMANFLISSLPMVIPDFSIDLGSEEGQDDSTGSNGGSGGPSSG